MKVLLFILFSSITIWGCKNSPVTEEKKDYALIEDGDIYVEVFDSTNVDENRYTQNNTTFRQGNDFIYTYHHITKEGKHYLFDETPESDDMDHDWRFTNMDEKGEETFDRIKITVKAGLQPFIEFMPDYNQTVIRFAYLSDSGESGFNSVSGVIENEKNIWMHPPRDKYFRILELNPFPFIKSPYEVGNKWTWSLKIGSAWGDERWKTWEGSIENKYDYEITDKRFVDTEFGKIECFEINARAKSRIGETALTALFNSKYGFVTLDYLNIDSSKTILNLIEFKSDGSE